MAAGLSLPGAWCADQGPTTAVMIGEAPRAEAGVKTPAKAPALTVSEALEALGDEDEATRKQALAALEGCNDKDIPALEKAATDPDAEIRGRAATILKKVKRGEAAVTVTFADGASSAGLKFSGILYFMPAAAAVDQDKAKEEEKRTKSSRPSEQECARGEFTADAAGKISFGRFADGAYRIELSAPEGFPRQRFGAQMQLTYGVQPEAWRLYRGFTVQVKVVDEAGQPVDGVTVANMDNANTSRALMQGYPEGQIVGVLASMDGVLSDAKGAVVLKQVLNNGQAVGACKPGWQLTTQNLERCADGGRAEMTLTLRKLVPVEAKVRCHNQVNVAYVEVRVLLVPSLEPEVAACLGEDWRKALSKDKIDTYIQQGAVDLGTTGALGELSVKALPDSWSLVGFPKEGKEVLYGLVTITSRNKQVQAYLCPLSEQGLVRGGRGKILCPPMEVEVGVVGDKR